jgi:hypothetical protein
MARMTKKVAQSMLTERGVPFASDAKMGELETLLKLTTPAQEGASVEKVSAKATKIAGAEWLRNEKLLVGPPSAFGLTRREGSVVFIPTNAQGVAARSEKNATGYRGGRTYPSHLFGNDTIADAVSRLSE